MKKIIKSTVLTLLVLSLFSTLFACKSNEHEHSFENWETTKSPTAFQNGEEKRSCSCGESETRKIDAVGVDGVLELLQGKWEIEDSDGNKIIVSFDNDHYTGWLKLRTSTSKFGECSGSCVITDDSITLPREEEDQFADALYGTGPNFEVFTYKITGNSITITDDNDRVWTKS